jgi:hypothetical protein
MRRDTAPAFFFTFTLGVAVLVVIGPPSWACNAESVVDAIKQKSAVGCIEFWLNRYQTLLAGIFSLCAAGLAYYLVQKQIGIATEQVKVTAGLIAPDFWIRPAMRVTRWKRGEIPECVLFCANQNRRLIELTVIRMVFPPNAHIAVTLPNGAIRTENENGSVSLHVEVPGTRPNAPVANQVSLPIFFGDKVDDSFLRDSTVEVVFEVSYTVLAPVPRYNVEEVRTRIELPQV